MWSARRSSLCPPAGHLPCARRRRDNAFVGVDHAAVGELRVVPISAVKSFVPIRASTPSTAAICSAFSMALASSITTTMVSALRVSIASTGLLGAKSKWGRAPAASDGRAADAPDVIDDRLRLVGVVDVGHQCAQGGPTPRVARPCPGAPATKPRGTPKSEAATLRSVAMAAPSSQGGLAREESFSRPVRHGVRCARARERRSQREGAATLAGAPLAVSLMTSPRLLEPQRVARRGMRASNFAPPPGIAARRRRRRFAASASSTRCRKAVRLGVPAVASWLSASHAAAAQCALRARAPGSQAHPADRRGSRDRLIGARRRACGGALASGTAEKGWSCSTGKAFVFAGTVELLRSRRRQNRGRPALPASFLPRLGPGPSLLDEGVAPRP